MGKVNNIGARSYCDNGIMLLSRRWKRYLKGLKTIILNIHYELKYAFLGVRRVDVWTEDEMFVKILGEIGRRTLLNPCKLYVLYQLAQNALFLKGEIAELGVYKGGSAKLLAEVLEINNSQKKILLFDSFQGLPTPDKNHDVLQKGNFSADVEDVKGYLSKYRNIFFYKGFFSETLPTVTNDFYSLVHIDADIYKSTLECCDYFYPRMSHGGVMLFDDYGYISCPGAKKAIDSFFVNKNEIPIYLHTGQCVVIKQEE